MRTCPGASSTSRLRDRPMADGIQIEREETETKGRYFYQRDGHVAEMTYSRAGEKRIIIDHTEVPDAFRGEGIGLMLVTRAVEDARREGRKIIPLCPFAKAQFEKHAELRDVLR
jgi:predicted GNAT family acetyltransferase